MYTYICTIEVVNRKSNADRIMGAKIQVSPCSARTCTKKAWYDEFTYQQDTYNFQLPVPLKWRKQINQAW